MKQQIKVLFDTNVLFGHDNRLFIDNIATKNLCECYWSPHIIGELYRTMTVKKLEKLGFRHAKQLSISSKKMMDIMEPYFYCVNSYSQIDMHLKYSIQDPDDFHLYQAATIAEVDYIVTINGRDLKGIKDRLESRGTKVINLKEFKHLMITRIQAI